MGMPLLVGEVKHQHGASGQPGLNSLRLAIPELRSFNRARAGGAPVLAREEPELEATALGRVGLRLRGNAPGSRVDSGRLRSVLLRALTALGGIAAGCKKAAVCLLQRPEAAVPVTTAGFQVGGIKPMATNPMFGHNATHGKDLLSATRETYHAAEARDGVGGVARDAERAADDEENGAQEGDSLDSAVI